MTVVLPRVSTAGSLRMMARRVRHARHADGQGDGHRRRQAFGDRAHGQRHRRQEHVHQRLRRAARPTTAVSTASPRMTHSSSLLNVAILRVRGVLSSCAVAIRSEMRPTSVASPVVTTTPAPARR